MYLKVLTLFVDSFKFPNVGYYQSPTIRTIHNCFRDKSAHLRLPKIIFLPLKQLFLLKFGPVKTSSGQKFDYS